MCASARLHVAKFVTYLIRKIAFSPFEEHVPIFYLAGFNQKLTYSYLRKPNDIPMVATVNKKFFFRQTNFLKIA